MELKQGTYLQGTSFNVQDVEYKVFSFTIRFIPDYDDQTQDNIFIIMIIRLL